jgi:hypothetical protein
VWCGGRSCPSGCRRVSCQRDPVDARKSIMGGELRVRRRDPRAAMIGA